MDVDDTRSRSPLSPVDMPVELNSPDSSALPQIEEDFIILLETLPELWNFQHEHYKNKYKREDGYKKLLKIFKKIKPKATVEDVRKKINSLRSNYRRELKKIAASKRSGAGVEDLYKPKSKSFQLLSFLYNTEKSDNSQQDQRPEGTDADHDRTQEPLNESEHSLSGPSFSSINTVVPPSTSIQIKKQKSLVAKQSELIDRANQFLSQTTLRSQQRVQETTISDSLAFVWAKKLDKLHPQQRFFAEKAVHDILFEAGLGNLHRFSVKINENSPLSRYSPSPSPSPTNYVINSPTPSHMQYCSGTPSPSSVTLHSSSAHLPLASPSIPLDTTPSHSQYSSAGPAQIFSVISPPTPPNIQHSSVTPSHTPVSLHSSSAHLPLASPSIPLDTTPSHAQYSPAGPAQIFSINSPPTLPNMQHSSVTPSPSSVTLHSSSAHLPLASPSIPLDTTPSHSQYSSAGPAQIFSVTSPPTPPNIQHSSVTPSHTPVSLHSSAGYSGQTNCQKGFSSQIVITPKTNAATTSNSSKKPQDTTYYLHIPDTEEYTVGSLFRDYNPYDNQ